MEAREPDRSRSQGPAEVDLAHRAERRLFDDASPGLDRFGILLVLTIASVVALSLIDLESIDDDVVRGLTGLALSLTTGITLVLALRAAGVAPRWRRISEALVVLATVTSVVALAIGLTTDTEVTLFESYRPAHLWVAIALVTPVAVVRRLLHHRRVTRQTLAGAVAAYLLIALAFCYVFLSMDAVLDGGFFGLDATPSHDFMYFSLVTMTTLGYGDLVPATPIGRLASTSEAVIGQVYLVTLVAMVVGLLIQQRRDD